jgi:hypothetical protein
MKKILIVSFLVLSLAAIAYAADCSTLTFITESLPGFTVGSSTHFDIEVIGGTGPYHFALTGGTMPAGLHLTGSGGIRGVPTTVTDDTIFVTVTDANGCQLTSAFAIPVDKT